MLMVTGRCNGPSAEVQDTAPASCRRCCIRVSITNLFFSLIYHDHKTLWQKCATLILRVSSLIYALRPDGMTYWAMEFPAQILLPWVIDFAVGIGNILISNLVKQYVFPSCP